jgi:hypothetical protein
MARAPGFVDGTRLAPHVVRGFENEIVAVEDYYSSNSGKHDSWFIGS